MSTLVKTKRKVTVLFTQTSTREVVETDAQTWGELQRQLSGKVSDKRIVVRENKNTLESTEALLPERDFVLFAYPKESKAGAKAAKKSKKAAKKVAKKKPAKKVAKKAVKKAAKGKVTASKGKKISKTVGAVASAKKAQVEEKEEDLFAEARDVKGTLPRY